MDSLKRSGSGIVIISLLLLLSFSLAVFGAAEEECCIYMEKPDCPPRYTSFRPSTDIYDEGETVKLTLYGLNDEYKMERIEIEGVGPRGEVVYSEEINQNITPAVSKWSWSWNQIGSSGEQVETGHYFAILETQCCGYYRTDFRIQRKVRIPRCSCCCGSYYMDLDTTCNRYSPGEDITVSFSNCNGCGLVFERLYVEREERCCGSEVVFSREFTDGFQPGRDWSWIWSQQNNSGNQVGPGQYTVYIETRCCGTLSTSFNIYERSCCQRTCCRSSYCCERRSCYNRGSRCCGYGFWPFFLGSCCNNCCN